jgi:uncharacterized iron-regulated membrane protein
MTLKQFVLKIHLCLGLFAGLIIFIVAVTGAIYAFEEEIRSLYEKDFWYVEVPENPVRYSLSEMKMKAEEVFRQNTHNAEIVKYMDARFSVDLQRSISFVFYYENPLIYKEVFINPYNGEVLNLKNMASDPFIISLELHRNLLLGSFGKEIIDYSSLVFLFMLISGIFLWWPRSRSGRTKRFKITFSPNPKQVNYNLHNVLGFYASWVAIFLVLTGFVWAFTWFTDSVDWIANGGENSPPHKEVFSDTSNTITGKNVLDEIYSYAFTKIPEAKRFYLGFPDKKEESIVLISYQSGEVYYDHNHFYFDQYSGELIDKAPYEDATNGDKILAMAYDIHIGKILGLPGQILAFCASLIIASLPVTGLRIWLGRRKKEKKMSSMPVKNRKYLFEELEQEIR